MIKLRDYQQETIDNARNSLKNHKHTLVSSPTGSGKTVMFSYIVANTLANNKKVWILSNRTELLTQTGGTLTHFGVKAEYISAKHTKIPESNCVVAMAQTLQRRLEKSEWVEELNKVDLFVIDEIHIQDYNFLFEKGYLKDKYVLGFTATPKRCGKQRQLGLDFTNLVNGVSVSTLIEKGFLVKAEHYTLDAPDLSNVGYNSLSGDYNENKMGEMFNNPKRYEGVLDNFNKICPNAKTIVFCCNQTHAINTCKAFNDAGISAKFLISGISKKNEEDYKLYDENKHYTGNRKKILDDFKENKFQVLVNAAILTTGFDEPSIECVIVNRATLSQPLWLQMIGRGSRLYKGKDKFIILDFGNNVSRHGLYEQERKWGLWHETKEGGGVAMSKECPEFEKDSNGKNGCGMIIHIGYSACPYCGYVFATPEELRIVELKKIIGGSFKFTEMTPEQLVAYAELHGRKKTWVYRMLYEGANDRREFTNAMKALGYNFKFIYMTYDRIHNSKKK